MSKPKKDDRLSNPESYELPDALQKQAKALLEARRDLVFIPGQNEVGDDGAEESADDEDDDPEARGDTLNSLRPRAFLRLRSDVEDDIRAKYPECRWGEKRLRTLAEHRLFTIVRPGFWAKKQDLAPAVTAGYEVPLWEDIDQGVLHLAYMRRPHMLWLLRTLGQRTNGAPAYTSLAAACVLHTGTSRDEPHLLKARKVLLTGIGQSSFDIAYGFPVYVKSEDDSRLDEGTTTGSMRRVINCSLQQMNAEVVVHANVAAFREMKERVDAGLQSREVKVGEVCAIDGQFLKADVNVDGKRTNFADLIKELQPSHGPLLGYEFVKKEHRVGRKRVAITCVRTRRALVWTYINGSAKEHTVVEYLIRLLFRLWPECPIRVLVGDKAYDLKRAVHAFLLFNCGIWPVFYQRKGYALRWPDKVFKPYCDGKSGVRGVPLCPQAHGLMQLVDTAGHELTPEKRIKMLSRSKAAQERNNKTDFTDASDQEIADAMKAAEPVSFPLPGEGNRRVYLRFECKTCGESANTTVHLDPRIYTKYPREGEGQWVNERLAIENSRTSIESVHAELLWLGDAQKGTHKIVKDTDWKVAWLDGLAVHALTLRYLVHLDGTYERARIDLRRYGFNIGNRSDGEQVGLDHVPLNASERKRVRAEMESLAAPPASWVKAKGEDAVALTGYSRESRIRDLVAAPG